MEPIRISDDDMSKFDEVGRLLDSNFTELGRMRAEYAQRERELLTTMESLAAERDSLIRAFGRTYLKDVSTGRWSFDPAQRAFVQQGV